MGNHNKRNTIAEREPSISGKFLKDFFCLSPYRIVILYYKQRSFDLLQELDGQIIMSPVSEQGHGFAYNVPCGIKRNSIISAMFQKITGFLKIGVVGT